MGKEKERFMKYRDYLTETATRLVGSHISSQRNYRAEGDEQILRWRAHWDPDPGPIPEEINKSDTFKSS